MTSPAAAETPRPASETSHVASLIASIASLATAVLVLTAHGAWSAAHARPLAFAVFLVLSVALQLAAVDVYGRGSISVAGIGLLLVGFTFGVGAAAVTAVLVAVLHGIRRRSRPNRVLFNAGTLALAASAAAAVYTLPRGHSTLGALPGAFLAGVAFWVVNIGLLTCVMSFAEGIDPRALWVDRFRWLTLHYLAFGPLALAARVAYEKVGLTGLIAFVVPPAVLMLSVRQYLEKTRESVERLQHANAELAQRNTDLRDLFEFAAGLASLKHDRRELSAGVKTSLERITGAQVELTLERVIPAEALPINSGGRLVGGLQLEGGDEERWGRLREAILPQLGTAIESTLLVDQVRKTHLETIAALSRSMEAKDLYTGGHTERVSSIAVELGRRLGYRGADLDAIEIGALLHDIGKIGIPERILHKEGPLDGDEWEIMREHPVISAYILSEIDLSPIVGQIARNSHERYDGNGYPDRLAGEDIPLPARIVLVADAFDALTSDRPYRRARPAGAALDELRAHTGTQFCPRVIDAIEQLWREQPQVLTGERLRAVG